MHVVTGAGELESFRPDDYLAFYRRLCTRFLAAVASGAETYPYPVEHCGLCGFLSLCREQWERDDHVTLVAGMLRTQLERLVATDIRRSRARRAADQNRDSEDSAEPREHPARPCRASLNRRD